VKTRKWAYLLSMFVLGSMFFVMGQQQTVHHSQMNRDDNTAIQVQANQIGNLDDATKRNSDRLDRLELKLSSQDSDISRLYGAIYGFGGLLSVLQIVGLVRKTDKTGP